MYEMTKLFEELTFGKKWHNLKVTKPLRNDSLPALSYRNLPLKIETCIEIMSQVSRKRPTTSSGGNKLGIKTFGEVLPF